MWKMWVQNLCLDIMLNFWTLFYRVRLRLPVSVVWVDCGQWASVTYAVKLTDEGACQCEEIRHIDCDILVLSLNKWNKFRYTFKLVYNENFCDNGGLLGQWGQQIYLVKATILNNVRMLRSTWDNGCIRLATLGQHRCGVFFFLSFFFFFQDERGHIHYAYP